MHLFIATDSTADRLSIYSEIWSIYLYILTLMTACTDETDQSSSRISGNPITSAFTIFFWLVFT